MLTGAYGQLGSELQDILKQGMCREGAFPYQFCNAQIIAAGLKDLDITDRNKADRFLYEHKPDVLINCAAYTAVDKAEKEIEICMRVNRDGAMILAELCSKYQIKYVYPSSESVFGGEQKVPYNEKDLTNPQNIYGKSKLLGEKAVMTSNSDSLILRAGWLYGFHGKNFVKTIAQISKEKRTIKVVNDQFGNPTNADVFCLCLLKLLDADAKGIFHCADEGTVSRYTFAQEIINILGYQCFVEPCTTEEYPLPAPRAKYMGLDCGKIEAKLGITLRNWRIVLKDYIQSGRQKEVL